MKTASLLRRLEALERRLSSVEQERITVVIERRDQNGEGGPDSVISFLPSQHPQTIQRAPGESYEAFRVRADL